MRIVPLLDFSTRDNASIRVMVHQTAVVGLVWTVALVVFGTLLHAATPAESCSSWPLCDGKPFPPDDGWGLLSFVHRVGGLGLIVVSGIMAFLSSRGESQALRRATAGLFVVVLIQAVFGGFGVALAFPSWTTGVHLALSLVVVAGLFCVALLAQDDETTTRPTQAVFAGLAALALAVGLVTGAAADIGKVSLTCGTGSCLDLSMAAPLGAPGLVWLSVVVSGVFAFGALTLATVHDGRLQRPPILAVLPILLFGLVAISAVGPWPPESANWGSAFQSLPLIAAWALLGHTFLSASLPRLNRLFGVSDFALSLSRIRTVGRDLLRVTKPGIMVLLLTTTLAGMLVAARGWPGLALVSWTLLGGALASGGASALNCFFDRDIDAVMARTRRRPIPTGGLDPYAVLAFGLALSAIAVVELAVLVNPAAAALALGGNLFYVLVYTLWLKRTTPQNIVIGGAAGSFPPLVGWAAVTGSLDWLALVIAAIIFFWTPPHFWSLALLKANDYRRAGIPMLPVTHGERATRRSIVRYSLLLLGLTLVPSLLGAGWIYLGLAIVLGGYFLVLAVRMAFEDNSRLAWRLFTYSNAYLALLLAALVVDQVS